MATFKFGKGRLWVACPEKFRQAVQAQEERLAHQINPTVRVLDPLEAGEALHKAAESKPGAGHVMLIYDEILHYTEGAEDILDFEARLHAWPWPTSDSVAAIYDHEYGCDPEECTCHLGHAPCGWCTSERNPANHEDCKWRCGPHCTVEDTGKLIATEATEQDRNLDPDAVQRAHRDFMRGL